MAVGELISGRYEIFRLLGQGGMGEVYAAHDNQLERRVALKAIRSEHRLEPASRARFVREARALSKLEHDAICRIYDYIESDKQDYLVLELIEGESLRDRISSGNFTKEETLRLAEQIVDALAMAHAEGLIHRDLKPGNIMLTHDGDAKILDFGLARTVEGQPTEAPEELPQLSLTDDTLTTGGDDLTRTTGDDVTRAGSTIGTPLYMSPEQARGEPLTPASDLFSLGLVLHEMLSGQRAYGGPFNRQLEEAIAEGRPSPIEQSGPLADLIEKLKSPAASRRPTAQDTLEKLRTIREAPQKRLRIGLIAAVVILSIFAAVKYTVDLSRERAAAEFRRAQSDAQIEFMVEELYKKLEPVGRLDILKDVGDKALEYFDTLDNNERTAEDDARFGRTLTQIGHVHLSLSELDEARNAFQQSVDTHTALVAQDATNPEWQLGLSAAHFGLGNVAWFEDDLQTVERHFEAYLTISETLMQIDANEPKHQLELGYALHNLAALAEANGQYERALGLLERSVDIVRRLVDGDPENREYQFSLANTFSWLARVSSETGDHETAVANLQSELSLRRLLAKDGKDASAKRHLDVALNEIGRAKRAVGDLNGALEHFDESVKLSSELGGLDPSNMEWKLGYLQALTNRGDLLRVLGRLDEALMSSERAYVELKKLAISSEAQPEWIISFEDARENLAQVLCAQNRHQRALEILMSGPSSGDILQHLRRKTTEAEATFGLGRAEEARILADAVHEELQDLKQAESFSGLSKRISRLRNPT